MRRPGRRVIRGVLGSTVSILSVGALVIAASCSLDLDEGLIDRPAEAGTGDATQGPLSDANADTGSPTGPDAAPCEDDSACKATHACLTGKCDLSRKTCVYDVCKATACNAAVCDVEKATCGAQTPYKLKATQFSLGQQILCGNCAVAVHPWLFVVTPTGVVAYNVSNVGAADPPQVPITGLGFVPGQMIQAGGRVWLLGGQSGPGPSRFPIAYIDPPADPFATKIAATTVLVGYDRPSEGISLFNGGGGAALLIGPAASQYPSSLLEPPLVEPVSKTTTALPFAQNTGPVATSGRRLLMGGLIGATETVNFIEGAGTATPQGGLPVGLPEVGAVGNQRRFAQSADGAIFFAAGVHVGAPPDVRTRALRGHFVVADQAAPIVGNVGVDIEVYDDPAVVIGENGGVLGPLAMIDAKTVMVTALARENAAQTAVDFIVREPLGFAKDPGGQIQRQVLPVGLGAFAAATASNGIGYLVANDQPGPPATGTVYVFDPACAK